MLRSPNPGRLFAALWLTFWGTAAAPAQTPAEGPAFPLQARRILFLGDSITHAGGYIDWIDIQLRRDGRRPRPELINAGLSSETCSGLSEPDHPFPRPDVHERLERALAAVRPDVVVACYGMNDGIYHPLEATRFQAFQQGLRRLVDKVHAAGAKVVVMTPPPFDPAPLRDKDALRPPGQPKYAYFAVYENYDDVLAAYSRWILDELRAADLVVDLHGPLSDQLRRRRAEDPSFTLAPDGIHPNEEGQRLLAETILKAWGVEPRLQVSADAWRVARQRGQLLHDAWLTRIGHQRPGVQPGLPLEEAERQAELLATRLEELLAREAP